MSRNSGETRRPRRPYVESPVIMSTVRLVTPFVLTFGLFVTLHGASSPGGGFQGGVIAAAVIIMLSIAYGTELTWEWIDKRALVGVTAGGIALFGGIALGTVFFGGDFFELGVYPVPEPDKYGIELVEVGIGMIVTGVITSLYFTLARGAMSPTDGDDADGDADTDGPPAAGNAGDPPATDTGDSPPVSDTRGENA